jgi:AraC-like DNA-binding protein
MERSRTIRLGDCQPHLRLVNLFPCPPNFNSGERRLYDHYLLYVHQGSGTVILESQTYAARAGDLFFCLPGQRNTIIADGQDPFILSGINFDFTADSCQESLQYPIRADKFDPDLALPAIRFSDFCGFPPHMHLAGQPMLRSLILDMAEQFRIRQLCWNLLLDGQMKTVVAWLARIIQQGDGQGGGSNMLEILRYIAGHYREPLTNLALAARFHYHPDVLNRIITRYTGVTLKQYIIDLRIQDAITQLLQSHTPVHQIAASVGYADLSHFNRIFRQKTGCSPGRFRQLVHE